MEDEYVYRMLGRGMVNIYNTQVCSVVYMCDSEYKRGWSERRRDELRGRWETARARWIYGPIRVFCWLFIVLMGIGLGLFIAWLTGDGLLLPLLIGVMTSQVTTLFWMVSEDWYKVRDGKFLRGYMGRFGRRRGGRKIGFFATLINSVTYK